jgi:hypothetical protein
MAGRGGLRSAVVVAATLGALWGLAAYGILWGYTSIVVTPSFFRSAIGLVTLLPARIVLWGIGQVERHVAHHSFSFASNHGWIGALSTCVGALVVGLQTLAVGWAVRARRHAAKADER